MIEIKGRYSEAIVFVDELDEAPQAYKLVKFSEKAVEPTAIIVEHLHPIYNFKVH